MRVLIAALMLTACAMGQLVVESGTNRIIGPGDKLQVGRTYTTNFTPPQDCVLVTRVTYGLRGDDGRWRRGTNNTLPWTCPSNVYRHVWFSVGYQCPEGGIVWVQRTIHLTSP